MQFPSPYTINLTFALGDGRTITADELDCGFRLAADGSDLHPVLAAEVSQTRDQAMTDHEFLVYCLNHSSTPRCGFIPAQIARLLRLASPAYETEAAKWDRVPNQVVDCPPDLIRQWVIEARRMTEAPDKPLSPR